MYVYIFSTIKLNLKLYRLSSLLFLFSPFNELNNIFNDNTLPFYSTLEQLFHTKEGIIIIISFLTKFYLIKGFLFKFDLIFIILNFCGIL